MTELNTPEIAHYIGGGQHAGAGTRTQAVYNPATGQVSAKVKLGNQQDIDNAVASAQAAFPAWADTPPLRRARVLFNFLALLNENKEKLAAMITAEHGKVLSDAMGEVTRGI